MIDILRSKEILPLQIGQTQVNMHSRARSTINGFGHEGGIHAVLACDAADNVTEQDGFIHHGQRVIIFEVDFDLRGTVFNVGGFNLDT